MNTILDEKTKKLHVSKIFTSFMWLFSSILPVGVFICPFMTTVMQISLASL